MLSSIVGFSLRFRGVVVSLAALALIYGYQLARNAKLDVFPDFVPPQITVQTEAPGLGPEQVEALVTRPIESALNGLAGQAALRSESAQGLSVITIVFQDGTPILPARQLLAEKLGELAGQLPAGVKAPRLSPLMSATMDLLKIGLVSDRLTPMELRTFADWTVRPRLLAAPGVAKCSVFGGEVRQTQIQVDSARLVAHNLALADVLNAARLATGVRGAGFIETENQRLVIQTEGQALTPEALGAVVVAGGPGAVVRLRDVATIVEGAEAKFGEALIMGQPGVLLTMSSQYGTNTMEVTLALEAALEELKPVFAREGITLFSRLHRPATFIETSLQNVRHSLVLGAALVAIVLLLFLGHFRAAVISIISIPLSLLAALAVMDRLGITLNTMTLGGLAIALGEVVDDAIIDVENILRRLRENDALPAPRVALAVVFDASLEVRSAVVFATFVVVLVFVPVLALTGVQGSFFAPLALSYILAILASLAVALTVTPALSLLWLTVGARRQPAPPRLQQALRRGYEKLLAAVARHALPVTCVVLAACGLALSRLPRLGGEFLPEFREGHFVLAVSTAPGTSLPEMLRIGQTLSRQLLANPQIATVEQQIGRAEQGEDPWGPHRSEFHVELKPALPGETQEQVEKEIRAVLERTPGIQSEVMTFLADRIGESITGETAPVVINLFGENLDQLDAKAAEIAQALGDVPGAADVQVKSPPGAPRLAVRLRPERLAAFGLRPVEALEMVQAAFQGAVVGQIHRGSQVHDLAVTLPGADRRDPESIGELLLSAPGGARVRLREVADIALTSGRFSILREGARRRQTVVCNPEGRDVQSFVAEARQALQKVPLPAGMYLEYSGAAEAREAATRQLLRHAAFATAGIILLLFVVLGNWRNVALVLLNLPFALAGGVIAVTVSQLLGEGAFSMGSLVGFVTLFGITTRNAIMLLSHYEHLVRREGQPWNLATAIRGASERLAPILMTAAVAGLGLLPLAWGAGEAGREIEGPMAIVILGGLCTSTVLNLIVLPPLALRWARWASN